MKPPADIIGHLTLEQQGQVEAIERIAEDRLRSHDRAEFNVSETRSTVAEEVWVEVVRRAKQAGWTASRSGAFVNIGLSKVG
jgi:hypothetical protein